MGQYYRIYTRNTIGREGVFDNRIYFLENTHPSWLDEDSLREDNRGKYLRIMYKLMEHSWMDDPLAEAFTFYLYSHYPMRVVWCGDYAEPDECTSLGFSYELVWGDRDTDREPIFDRLYYPNEEHRKKFDKCKYFVNETKKIYLDLERYKQECTTEEGCIYPVSLLTALGNDRGGGDFHKGCIGYAHVGEWAGDLVTIQEEKPSGYEEFTVRFIEKLEE